MGKTRVGILAEVDSGLNGDKRMPDKDAVALIDVATSALAQEGFEVEKIGLMNLFEDEPKKGRYIQLTVTENEQTSMSGKKILYRCKVTTVLVWIEDHALPQKHKEKIIAESYQPYSRALVTARLGALMPVVCGCLHEK